MPTSMLCAQCGAPAERCTRCAGALCVRKLCAELHDAACAAISAMPEVAPVAQPVAVAPRKLNKAHVGADHAVVRELIVAIARHREDGRSALLVGELDAALHELWAARDLELQLDRLGPAASRALPDAWDLETDLTPLARALSARNHPRASESWRRVLEDRPARSVQAEAAGWLARNALAAGEQRLGLRIMHAGSQLGRTADVGFTFASGYRQAGVDPAAAFGVYLAATRLDTGSARAAGLCDPLTDQAWVDQDPRWWRLPGLVSTRLAERHNDHQAEALGRARDLVQTRRDEGWLLLAEGDYLAGPLGSRALGRAIRAGSSEAADHDALVRIRLCFEGAADRLPDVAWPWYRLAELLAWSGFADRAQEHLREADRRSLGGRAADRATRPVLRALVDTALGSRSKLTSSAPRPFPAEPFGPPLAWRLRLR